MAFLRGVAVLLLISHRTLAGSDGCPSSYTSKNGLSFKTYCKQDLGYGNDECSQDNACDIRLVENVASMEDCMTACSENYGQRCFAVSYNPSSGDCYLKGNKSDSSNLSKSGKWNSAIAESKQLKAPSNTSCPVSTNDKMATNSGMPFTILCDQDLGAAGEYCSGVNSPCAYHADSLQKCLDYCAAARPLCKGVSWNADMEVGYANCFLKKNPDATNPSKPSGYIMHSAKLPNDALSRIDTSVPTSLNYTTSNGAFFNITQSDSRSSASNFSSIHADSVSQCMDKCSSAKDSNCTGVLFDNVINNGFSNCYLLNNIGTQGKSSNMTFAQLSKAPDVTPVQDDSGRPTNKAWIAGPIVAVCVVIGIFAALMIWQRRRQRRTARLSSYGMLLDKQEETVEEDGTSPFEPIEVNRASYIPEMSMTSISHELPSPEPVHPRR